MNKNFLDKKNKQLSKSNKKIISYLKIKYLYFKEIEKCVENITGSKAFNFWKKYQKIKKTVNPKTYLNFIKNKIKKYKYNLLDFETPCHGFILLKTKTNKWKTNGFERVGEDWHIRIIRKKDEKIFLLDQPFFYYLQIFKNSDVDKELFMTYGITKENLIKIKKTIKLLNLC